MSRLAAPYRLFKPSRFWHVEVPLLVDGKRVRVRRSTKAITRSGAEDCALAWSRHLRRTGVPSRRFTPADVQQLPIPFDTTLTP